MAFDSQNLSVLAYANGFTLWHYKSTADTLATLTGSGYFNNASDMLRLGDTLTLQDSGDDVAAIRVAGNSGGVVSIAHTPAQSAAIVDTSGAALAALETEVNNIKAALRTARIIAP